MRIIGIDPGLSGAVCYIDGPTIEAIKMPEILADIVALLESVRVGDCMAFIEKVGAMPKQGVSSTFKFGRNFGNLEAVLAALRIPFEYVLPVKWQTALSCRSGGDKNVTKGAAQRLWPSQKWTHATADAALIAEFGRREVARRNVS